MLIPLELAVVLVALILSLVALSRLGGLARRLDRLEATRWPAAPVRDDDDGWVTELADDDQPTEGPIVVGAETSASAGSAPAAPRVEAGVRVAPVPRHAADPRGGRRQRSGRRASAAGEDLESILGRRVLAIVGGVVLLAGIAYFLRYAYDTGLIGPSGRLVIGALFGCLLVGIGQRERRRLGAWADLVTAVGHGSWYLCCYFAAEVWTLWSPTLALALTGLNTLLVLLESARRRSPWLLFFALAAGHATPFLMRSASEQPVMILGWIAVLAAAGLGLSSWRGWGRMGPFIVLFGMALFIDWQDAHYRPEYRDLVLGFALAMMAIYAILPQLGAILRRDEASVPLLATSWIALMASALEIRWLLPDAPRLAALFLGGAAVFALVPARLVGSRSSPGRTMLGQGIVLVVAALGGLAGMPVPPLLAAGIAAQVAETGRRRPGRLQYPVLVVLAGFPALLAAVAAQPSIRGELTAFAHPAFLVWFAMAGVFALGAWLARGSDETGKPSNPTSILLFVLALLAGALAWQLEISAWWRWRQVEDGGELPAHLDRYLTIIDWSLVALTAGLAGRWSRVAAWRLLGLSTWTIASLQGVGVVVALWSAPGAADWYVFNPRFLAGSVWVLATIVLVRSLGGPGRGRKAVGGGDLLAFGASFLPGLLLLGEVAVHHAARGRDATDRMRDWLLLGVALQAAVVVLKLARRELPGAALRAQQVLAIGLLMPAAFAAHATGTLPLVDLDFGLRLLLGAAVLAGNRVLVGGSSQRTSTVVVMALQIPLAIALAVDLGLWSERSRAVLPFIGRVEERLGTSLVSAAWSIQALVLTIWGFRSEAKALRVAGLGLFGLVLGKVLLVDTASLPQVQRILSYVASGLLMLTGSWLYQVVARRRHLESGLRQPQ